MVAVIGNMDQGTKGGLHNTNRGKSFKEVVTGGPSQTPPKMERGGIGKDQAVNDS
jgi:hypothetical protein